MSAKKRIFVGCLCFSLADLLVLDLYVGPRAFARSEATPHAAAPSVASMVVPSAAAPTSSARAGDARSRVPRIVARFGSDEGAAYDDQLRALATAMIEDPGATIVLEGHSDRRGPAEYNQSLSLERANWARRQLILYGVSASRVETIGRGVEAPLDESTDDPTRSENRRVEVRWADK